MRAGDVKVGEVGGVGFVEVVVAFCEWGVGSCYSWEEDGRRRYFCRDNAFVKHTMAQDGVVDSNRPHERPVLDVYEEQHNHSRPRIATRTREGTEEEIAVL